MKAFTVTFDQFISSFLNNSISIFFYELTPNIWTEVYVG